MWAPPRRYSFMKQTGNVGKRDRLREQFSQVGTAVAALLAVFGLTQSTFAAAGDSLVVATYNLRYASATPPNSWPERRPLVRTVIEHIAPDVLGTQEGVYPQLKDIAADLPDFNWIGLGRDGGSRGEFMAVFYRTSRLEPLEFDHFWLSDTPSVVGSSTWGNRNRRMVTWVRFKDRAAGNEFYFFNTHFDHEVQLAREKSALLLRDRVRALNTTLPVILAGDFNATARTNAAYSILTETNFFTDTWEMAETRRGEGVATFNNFTATVRNGFRIDWVLVRGDVRVDAAEVVTLKPEERWASDHFPVVAVVRFETSN